MLGEIYFCEYLLLYFHVKIPEFYKLLFIEANLVFGFFAELNAASITWGFLSLVIILILQKLISRQS